MNKYEARCASDRDPNWPYWYISLNGLNVLKNGRGYGGKFDTKEFCITEAERLNSISTDKT